MIAGIVCGYLLRSKKLSFVPRVIEYSIFALLLFLGIFVGANPEVMDNLTSIGLDAAIIASGATLGSMIVAWALYHFIFKKR